MLALIPQNFQEWMKPNKTGVRDLLLTFLLQMTLVTWGSKHIQKQNTLQSAHMLSQDFLTFLLPDASFLFFFVKF